MHFEKTLCGFEWGSAVIERCTSDENRGWIIISLKTPKHEHIQIYVTKTGKVRIMEKFGEWLDPYSKEGQAYARRIETDE